MTGNTKVINKFGSMVGWNNITVNLLGADLQGIEELSYSDEVKKENVYGAGAYPIGRSIGNYQAKASITLRKEEVDHLLSCLPQGKHLHDIESFDITVEYTSNQGKILKDRIRNCEFTGNGIESKNDGGSIAHKFELLVSHIEWNVK